MDQTPEKGCESLLNAFVVSAGTTEESHGIWDFILRSAHLVGLTPNIYGLREKGEVGRVIAMKWLQCGILPQALIFGKKICVLCIYTVDVEGRRASSFLVWTFLDGRMLVFPT